MLQRKIILGMILIFLVLILSSFLLAQMQEYKDYTVIKGDTLWDISKKEIENPFSWPKVWKENPGITNPDKIYPGQKIRIPLYLLQKEITLPEIPEVKKSERLEKKEEPKKEIAKRIEPPKREYLVDKNLLIASGYITDSVQSVGSIVDSPSGRSILGKGDYAYIKTYKPTKVGEKFYIIRSAGKVNHPKSGLVLGYLIEVLGIAEVVGQDNSETKIKITASYSDISPGSLLDSYSEVELPYRPETPRKPSINGYVVATKELRMLNGMWDIVYIDKGRKEGLKVGDLVATTIQGKHGVANSEIQIINLKESTATAIIRKSSDIVTKGDKVISLK
jgi:LysM repeat protein